MNRRITPKQVTTFLGISIPLCGGWAWLVDHFFGLNQISSASVIALGSAIIVGGVGIWLSSRNVDCALVTAYAKVALEKCEEELAFHAEEMRTEAGDQYLKACRYFEGNIEGFIKQCEMRRKKDMAFLRRFDPADESKIQTRFSAVKDSVLENCRQSLKILNSGTSSNRHATAAEAIAEAAKKIKSSADTVQLAHRMLE